MWKTTARISHQANRAFKAAKYISDCTLYSTSSLKILEQVAATEDLMTWNEEIAGKIVYVVGTGPGKKNLKTSYGADAFAVLVNFALYYRARFERSIYFSTDIARTRAVFSSDKDFTQIPPDRRVLAPIYTHELGKMNAEEISKYTWISASNYTTQLGHFTIKFLSAPIFRLPKPPCTVASVPTQETLTTWWHSEDQVTHFPVFHSTSALSAVIFAAKYRPKKIVMVGCGFYQSEHAISLHGRDSFEPARTSYFQIALFLRERGIVLENAELKH